MRFVGLEAVVFLPTGLAGADVFLGGIFFAGCLVPPFVMGFSALVDFDFVGGFTAAFTAGFAVGFSAGFSVLLGDAPDFVFGFAAGSTATGFSGLSIFFATTLVVTFSGFAAGLALPSWALVPPRQLPSTWL